MIATLPRKSTVEYPTSDGKPVAETDLHFREILALFQVLDYFFETRGDVYVAANNFVYFEEGNPKACFSPDVYVVYGVSKETRESYKVWEEGGRVPMVVFELTSKSTQKEDLGKKKALCENLGVQEYFLYDPKGEYLTPPLRGFRLEQGRYSEIAPDSKGHRASTILGLKFFVNPLAQLGVIDTATGLVLPRAKEYKLLAQREAEGRRIEAEGRRIEAEGRRAAEAEVARLKAELAAKDGRKS